MGDIDHGSNGLNVRRCNFIVSGCGSLGLARGWRVPEKKKGRTASSSTSKKAAFAAPFAVTGSLEELDALVASVWSPSHLKFEGVVVGIKGFLSGFLD